MLKHTVVPNRYFPRGGRGTGGIHPTLWPTDLEKVLANRVNWAAKCHHFTSFVNMHILNLKSILQTGKGFVQ